MPKSEERMPITEQTLHGKKEKKREKGQSKKKNREMRDIWQDVIALLVGSALFSAALNLFLTPAGVALGGASGLAVAANHAWGLDVSTVILLLNVPLFCLSAAVYGFSFCVKTLIGTIFTALGVRFLTFLPQVSNDKLLCCVFGAVVMGIGTGILFNRDFTTGGTDHIVWLLRRVFPQLSVGKTVLMVDAAVVCISAWLMRSYESLFYSALGIAIYSYVLELVQDGSQRGELLWVVTRQHEAIGQQLATQMRRGVTLVPGKGYWGGTEWNMVLCAIRKNEFYRARQIILACDPNAFVILLRASQVLGEGFSPFA